MKFFAQLIMALDSTNKTNQKLAAIDHFLQEAAAADKLWMLALFTGKRPKRVVSTTLMKEWVLSITKYPQWLFLECYAAVGDLGEVISLLLPPAQQQEEKSLAEWMHAIIALKDADMATKKEFVFNAWHSLSHTERFIFNKLLGGSFRIGVSGKTMINALALHYQLEANAIAHSIMGKWDLATTDFDLLIKGAYTNTNISKPYPFCLAYPIDQAANTLHDLAAWQIEYKWDGIRAQLIKRDNEIFIWSRGEELITDQFPELRTTAMQWEGNFVIDGEILPQRNGKILDFSSLQKRLNRKTLHKQTLQDIPVVFYAYDILEINKSDIRMQALCERRQILVSLFNQQTVTTNIQLPGLLEAKDIAGLIALKEGAIKLNSEGLMIKHTQSIYHTGRKKGDWWKWKKDPFTLDAVLIYAQKGAGRRSSYYTDYTFAIKDGAQLVTIAKAYSGLTDEEIKQVSSFVNANAKEKFGPVRTVPPVLVFEIAFEGISRSNRHKAGVALRFPRIARWRKDKTAADIDELENIKQLIKDA